MIPIVDEVGRLSKRLLQRFAEEIQEIRNLFHLPTLTIGLILLVDFPISHCRAFTR